MKFLIKTGICTKFNSLNLEFKNNTLSTIIHGCVTMRKKSKEKIIEHL
jgi:hypothetical protein